MKSWKNIRNLLNILIAGIFVICICGNKKREVDTSNPEAVAKAFINALLKNDVKEAAKYVIPEERDELEKAFKKGIPPLPKVPDIRVIVKKNGIQADVRVVNDKRKPNGPPFGFDMKLKGNRWWIVK